MDVCRRTESFKDLSGVTPSPTVKCLLSLDPPPPHPPPPRGVHDFWSNSIGTIRTEILSTLQYKVSLENVCQLDFSFKNITLREKLRATIPQSLHLVCRSANVRFVVYLSFFSVFLFQKIKAMKEQIIYNIRRDVAKMRRWNKKCKLSEQWLYFWKVQFPNIKIHILVKGFRQKTKHSPWSSGWIKADFVCLTTPCPGT